MKPSLELNLNEVTSILTALQGPSTTDENVAELYEKIYAYAVNELKVSGVKLREHLAHQ